MTLDLAQRIAQFGCWEMDVRSARVWSSAELQRILEVSQGNYQPTVKEFVGLLTPPGSQILAAAVDAAIKHGTPFDVDVRVLSVKGRPLWLRVVGHSDAKWPDGARLYGVVQNITDQHLLEQAVVDGPRQVRRRMTLDLHDGLGMKLMEIEALLGGTCATAHGDSSPIAARLEQILERVRDATGACRSLAHGLTPVTQQCGGLIPALEELATRARVAENVGVTAQWRGADALTLPGATAEHLYQIAQHAVMSALRERASHIEIDFGVQRRELKLSVSSSGAASDAVQLGRDSAVGFMRHRARLIGGVLRISAVRGGRTRVTCILKRGRA